MTWQPRSFQKRMVLARDGAACRYCGRRVYPKPYLPTEALWHEIGLTFDHLIPHARGGPTQAWNLFISCYACNSEKGNRGPSANWSPMSPPENPLQLDVYRGPRKIPPREAKVRQPKPPLPERRHSKRPDRRAHVAPP